MELYAGSHRVRSLPSSAHPGASSTLLFTLFERSARQLRDQLTALLDDPDQLPTDVDAERVRGVSDVDQIKGPEQGISLVGVDWGKQKDRSVIAAFTQPTDRDRPPCRLQLLEVYEPDGDDPVRYSAVVEDVKRVAHALNAHRIVADEGEGAHQAELLEQEFGSRFVGFRFTKTSKPALIENVLWLCEQGLLELPIDEEEPRNVLLNVERREDGYEHASSKLKDVFDAMGLALTEARTGPQRSMDVLSAERAVDNPSVPRPATGGFAGGGPASLR